jgi:uncharacterized membrane protein YidH (DUF202 family)
MSKESTMDEGKFRADVAAALDLIQSLLSRSVLVQEKSSETGNAIHDLEKKRTEATSGLLEHAGTENALAQERTGMAEERTALVREQTRLSARSSELASIRTDLSRERTSLAGQRTDLAVLRTDFSRARTNLAGQRTTMAGTRTTLSTIRTLLARARTQLALIRTGLAFLSLSIGFFRYFGVSLWTVFDGALAVASVVMTVIGMSGYWRSTREVKTLEGLIAEGKEITV